MTDYPKHFLEIKNKIFQIGDNIVIEEDVDVIYKTLSFDFPEIIQNDFNSLELKKYDTVTVYFNEFNTSDERNAAAIQDCKKIFVGYIQEVIASEDKTSGVILGITCRSTLGLAYERTTLVKAFSSTIPQIISTGLTDIGLLSVIPYVYVSDDIDEAFIEVTSEYNFGKVLDSIKDKYPIKIFQTGDGGVWIVTPSFFEKEVNRTDKYTNTGSFKYIKEDENPEKRFIARVWNYDLSSNINKIDYGNTLQNVNCIVCYGLNTVGAAYDPIAYKNQFGTDTIYAQNLSVLTFFRRDFISNIDCRKFAYEKLLDMSKNYIVSFESKYVSDEVLGDLVAIYNSKLIKPDQLFTIKRRTITISKEDINANITVYRTGVAEFGDSVSPILLDLLTIDILNVQDQLEAEAITVD